MKTKSIEVWAREIAEGEWWATSSQGKHKDAVKAKLIVEVPEVPEQKIEITLSQLEKVMRDTLNRAINGLDPFYSIPKALGFDVEGE